MKCASTDAPSIRSVSCTWRARFARFCSIFVGAILFATEPVFSDDALDAYLARHRDETACEIVSESSSEGAPIVEIRVRSQIWREHPWHHNLRIRVPRARPASSTAFLWITGSGDGAKSDPLLTAVSDRAGIYAAALTDVPNQPLYGGRKEDALLAYTIEQYRRTGDREWPALFPMVRAAVAGMDCLVAWSAEHGAPVERFVIGGASKRGWTTWLAAAHDSRVEALVPVVFDMLNFTAQVAWAERAYGAQSSKIEDYTKLGLTEKLDEPRMRDLRRWIDPFHVVERITQPKLIVIGTNDPYWVVDSIRHYWSSLKGERLVVQVPNGTHHLSGRVESSIAVFVRRIVRREPLPRFDWRGGAAPRLSWVSVPKEVRIWSADSTTRDFRDAKWRVLNRVTALTGDGLTIEAKRPYSGYRAYLAQARFSDSSGILDLWSEVFVVPEWPVVNGRNHSSSVAREPIITVP